MFQAHWIKLDFRIMRKMKLLIILALFAAVAYALPVEDFRQNQEVAEQLDYENIDVVRQKRQFG